MELYSVRQQAPILTMHRSRFNKLPCPVGALEQHYTKAIPYGQLIMVMLQLRQLVMQPGQRIQLQEVNWHEFEAILDELGDKRACRIAYSDGSLEIRMPLPKH